jgi:hypothetical protein
MRGFDSEDHGGGNANESMIHYPRTDCWRLACSSVHDMFSSDQIFVNSVRSHRSRQNEAGGGGQWGWYSPSPTEKLVARHISCLMVWRDLQSRDPSRCMTCDVRAVVQIFASDASKGLLVPKDPPHPSHHEIHIHIARRQSP